LILRNTHENGKQDANEEVGATAALEEDPERWEEDGEDDLDDVAVKAMLAGLVLMVRV
jgi:hypothetical protein